MSMPDVLGPLALDAVAAAVRRALDEIDRDSPNALSLIENPVARAFVTHMAAHHGAKVRVKSDLAMRAVAAAFDVGRAFGAALPDGGEFMEHFATTVGAEIFLPESMLSGDVRALMVVVTHECEHVWQFQRGGIAMPWFYLMEPESRASLEADAYAAGVTVGNWLGLPRPERPEDAAPRLANSYHLRQDDVRLATGMLASAIASVSQGAVTTIAARGAIDWLMANATALGPAAV